MRLLGPTPIHRLNEATGIVFLFLAIFLALSLVSYHPTDPSWNTAAGNVQPKNLIGPVGSHVSDLFLQAAGVVAFVLPVFLIMLGWAWIRSKPIQAQFAKVLGSTLLVVGACSALSIGVGWRPFGGAIAAGGLLGMVVTDYLIAALNRTGAVLFIAFCIIISVYLVSSFSMEDLPEWLTRPFHVGNFLPRWWRAWSERRRQRKLEKRRRLAEARAARKARQVQPEPPPPIVEADEPPFEESEIPIRTLEDMLPAPPAEPEPEPTEEAEIAGGRQTTRRRSQNPPLERHFRLPSTELLNEPAGRNPFDGQELKEIAARIKSKFQEFNVLGSVVQINPGPVVTTFEFKPEAGIKYSRITTLTEDLCLGLQAESILIERIPGKPTVGIEVPNTNRELISLRQVLESEEFLGSTSRLSISLGKDINGRIKVAALDSMPHLLIAGSTGSGKSVMLNSMIMSILLKATPDEVRFILVDPKRVELGIYEGVPHLLTPVITDPRKANNALRNAVLEMERRLKLLAANGVRNIEQYNRKVRQLILEPRNLFEQEEDVPLEELKPLPYILILIDELADLMMVERAHVETAVTRLAQMARAVGMHLVLATQRPSVDVITGLIKANFPARVSFRVATRVDSRTILDVMGAEHLLGRGDMLFLPPGSSRLVRVHGAFITEAEINRVVDFWKQQADPDYDHGFLVAPPAEDEESDGEEDFEGGDDPAYEDAVRIVLEMGKASTSTLQRRLRLGYGRAARLLDMMQREGIIGPPDGSRPREVLKRPDWLSEVEEQRR
jgi:S-DNA-T family DNA segregation ATPase FtsK/SpoIIIE